MPPAPAGHVAADEHPVVAACALGVLAGGGELQLEDSRPWSARGAAEPASALAAPRWRGLSRSVRASMGGPPVLPTWLMGVSMFYDSLRKGK